jgi:hypothetical protein
VNSLVLSGTVPIVPSGTAASCYQGPKSGEKRDGSDRYGARNFSNRESFGFLLTEPAGRGKRGLPRSRSVSPLFGGPNKRTAEASQSECDLCFRRQRVGRHRPVPPIGAQGQQPAPRLPRRRPRTLRSQIAAFDRVERKRVRRGVPQSPKDAYSGSPASSFSTQTTTHLADTFRASSTCDSLRACKAPHGDIAVWTPRLRAHPGDRGEPAAFAVQLEARLAATRRGRNQQSAIQSQAAADILFAPLIRNPSHARGATL